MSSNNNKDKKNEKNVGTTSSKQDKPSNIYKRDENGIRIINSWSNSNGIEEINIGQDYGYLESDSEECSY